MEVLQGVPNHDVVRNSKNTDLRSIGMHLISQRENRTEASVMLNK
jgi:hypothetical protein